MWTWSLMWCSSGQWFWEVSLVAQICYKNDHNIFGALKPIKLHPIFKTLLSLWDPDKFAIVNISHSSKSRHETQHYNRIRSNKYKQHNINSDIKVHIGYRSSPLTKSRFNQVVDVLNDQSDSLGFWQLSLLTFFGGRGESWHKDAYYLGESSKFLTKCSSFLRTFSNFVTCLGN